MNERIQVITDQKLDELIVQNANEFIEVTINDICESKYVREFLLEQTKASLVNNFDNPHQTLNKHKKKSLKRSFSDTFSDCDTYFSCVPAPKVFVTTSDALEHIIKLSHNQVDSQSPQVVKLEPDSNNNCLIETHLVF